MGAGKISAILLLQLAAAPALALPEDTLRPYAEYTVYRDSNYFRLANDSQAQTLLGTTNTAATINQIGVGLDADVKISRQTLLLRSNIFRMRFDRPELQEQNGGNVLAQWNWQLGNEWSGELSSRKGRAVLSRADFGGREANVQDDRNTSLNANYRFHPSWLVKGGVGKSSLHYSAASRAVLDHDDNIASLGWAFVSPLDNQIGVAYRRTDGRYSHRPAPNDHFEQSELNLFGVWLAGGNTRIRGEAGYSSRKENQFVLRQPTWNLSADWVVGQTILTATVQRLIQASDSVASSTSNVFKGGNLSATWPISAKTALTASIKAENRDYSSISRIDKLRTETLGLTYQPTRSTQLSLAYEAGERNSTVEAADYRYRAATLNLRVVF